MDEGKEDSISPIEVHPFVLWNTAMSGFTLSINKVGTFRSILSPSTKYTHLDMQLIQTFKTLSLGTDTLHLLFGEIGMNIILLTINLSAEKHQYKKYAKGIVGNGLTGFKKTKQMSTLLYIKCSKISKGFFHWFTFVCVTVKDQVICLPR